MNESINDGDAASPKCKARAKRAKKTAMNHLIPSNLINAIVDDWNYKIDGLRNELADLQGQVCRNQPMDLAKKFADQLNDESNQLEIARRIFNHYLSTGVVVYPD